MPLEEMASNGGQLKVRKQHVCHCHGIVSPGMERSCITPMHETMPTPKFARCGIISLSPSVDTNGFIFLSTKPANVRYRFLYMKYASASRWLPQEGRQT